MTRWVISFSFQYKHSSYFPTEKAWPCISHHHLHPPTPISTPTPALIPQEHRFKKESEKVVYEQPACKQQTHYTWKSEFIIFSFKEQTLSKYILSLPSFTNLTPAVLVLATGNSPCARKTRENGALIWVCFMFSLAISFLCSFGGRGVLISCSLRL